MKRIVLLFLMLTPLSAVAAPPVLFYTDLLSGPASGGETVSGFSGTYVTLYGNYFGVSPTVTLNGASCLRVVSVGIYLWYEKLVVQLGSSCTTGNLQVTTASGSSNTQAFTVRSGNIYFVATTGNNSNNGSFATPWATITKAEQIVSGDIVYFENGVAQTTVDNYGAAVAITSAGSSSSTPKSWVAYPGATVTFGSVSLQYGLRTPQVAGGPFNNWVIAGMHLVSYATSFSLKTVDNWRLIANDVTCPTGDGPSGCTEVDGSTNIEFLGNYVHDAGHSGVSKLYHAVYFGTNSLHLELAWNLIGPNQTCRGIQFHSTGGNNMYDIHVHDNTIHGTFCDGLNFATVDPSQGTVEAYNNVIYHVGLGPDPPDGFSSYTCIYSPGITNLGTPGSGPTQIYNNTLYDCGPYIGGTAAGNASGVIGPDQGNGYMNMVNNLIYQNTNEYFWSFYSVQTNTGVAPSIQGDHNDWLGWKRSTQDASSSPPTQTTANLSVDPLFTSTVTPDFHLLAGSPAIGAGVDTGLTHDIDGYPRTPPLSLGAYAFQSGAVARNPIVISGGRRVGGGHVMQ